MCVYVCARMTVCVCACAYMPAHTHTRMCVCVGVCVCASVCVCKPVNSINSEINQLEILTYALSDQYQGHGVVHNSALEHCRKIKFSIYIHLTLIYSQIIIL